MIGRFARFAARTFFRDIVLEGTQNLPEQGPVIFTPNHPNGLLDPMLLFFLSPPFQLRFVAKAPLFKIPVFGNILRAGGAIPVVRKFEASGEVDYSTFFETCLNRLAQGDSIVIFPEGRSLPQSYLAPLKTGPARLFLMARDRGIPVKIIPVGLNYEQGTTFRSRVLMCIAPKLKTDDLIKLEAPLAIRELTSLLADSLAKHVVQAETYRDRELMSLLEKLSAKENVEENNPDSIRFSRLKEFEHRLSFLRNSAPAEIDALRKLLSRYDRLSREYGIDPENLPQHRTSSVVVAILGAILAAPGWLFNLIPYHICDLLIRTTRKNASDAATYKVIYSLFLFPLSYILQGLVLHRYFGDAVAIAFFLLILPLSYFTLFFTEWQEARFPGIFQPGSRRRMKAQLELLQTRILQRMEKVRTL